MVNRVIEYLRLGRIFNAEILALLYVLTYIFTANLYNVKYDYLIITLLFFVGLLSHIWGAYNNDRLDLITDKKVKYCSHKPLVSGTISIKTAMFIEYLILILIVVLILLMSPKISTLGYLFGAYLLAYLYNKYNNSNMFINVIGQMYASFAILVSMSFIVNFDYIVFLSAIVIGLNGIYLNVIEADLKDIEGDIINVPKSLGLRFRNNKAENITKFYLVNEVIKVSMYLLVYYILYIENVELTFRLIAIAFFALNFIARIAMFKNLSYDREKMKPYFALQEITSILFISMIYVIVNPLFPIIIVLFVLLWLSIWNKILWGTYLRPQV